MNSRKLLHEQLHFSVICAADLRITEHADWDADHLSGGKQIGFGFFADALERHGGSLSCLAHPRWAEECYGTKMS